MATWLPIVLFVDRALPVAPFAEALAGELDCRDSVDATQAERVVALVTASELVGADQVRP